MTAIAVAAVLAGAVASVSGFGIGSLLTPVLVLSLPMPTADAVAVLAVPHALATAIRWVRLRRDVHRPTFREFGVASAAGGLAGAALQSRLSSPVLTVVLAALLVLAGTTELLRRRIPLPRTPTWRLAGGALSGMFGGLVGNQGGIRSAALMGFDLPKEAFVATATAVALVVDGARMPVYVWTEWRALLGAWPEIVAATAGVLVGTFAGVRVLRRIPEAVFRPSVSILITALGVYMLWHR